MASRDGASRTEGTGVLRSPQRKCPGVGRPCGSFMSPLFRDPHPTCARCRGIKCDGTTTCDLCRDWSVKQWDEFRKKEAHWRKKVNPAAPRGDPAPRGPAPPGGSGGGCQAPAHTIMPARPGPIPPGLGIPDPVPRASTLDPLARGLATPVASPDPDPPGAGTGARARDPRPGEGRESPRSDGSRQALSEREVTAWLKERFGRDFSLPRRYPWPGAEGREGPAPDDGSAGASVPSRPVHAPVDGGRRGPRTPGEPYPHRTEERSPRTPVGRDKRRPRSPASRSPAVLLAGISAGPVAPPLALPVLREPGPARVRTHPRCLATLLMVSPLGPRTVEAGVLVCRTLWTPTL